MHWLFLLDSLCIVRAQHRVFVNRDLRMDKIKYIGCMNDMRFVLVLLSSVL
jgi:hypothetical protein